MQNGMLPDTLFKLGGFTSFSDNNYYLELESATPPPLLEFLMVCSVPSSEHVWRAFGEASAFANS